MTFLNQATIEKFYKKTQTLWGMRPNRYVAEIPKIFKSGKVLDLGVGEGRNALFLAEKGFDVTGLDISQAAIVKFLALAEERDLQVNGIVIDALDYEPDTDYDIVICNATIHYFTGDQASKLIKKMKKYTSKGGINVLTAFTKRDDGFQQYPDFYFFEDEEELKKFYHDWEIIKCERYQKQEEHDGSGPHIHDIAAIIAKRIK